MNLGSRGRLYGSYTCGEGLGRYFVGITPVAGAFMVGFQLF